MSSYASMRLMIGGNLTAAIAGELVARLALTPLPTDWGDAPWTPSEPSDLLRVAAFDEGILTFRDDSASWTNWTEEGSLDKWLVDHQVAHDRLISDAEGASLRLYRPGMEHPLEFQADNDGDIVLAESYVRAAIALLDEGEIEKARAMLSENIAAGIPNLERLTIEGLEAVARAWAAKS
jgi:hypothetical protein